MPKIAATEQPVTTRLRVVVKGRVQGVGFRPFVYRLARECNLAGTVVNDATGVMIEVEGSPDRLTEFTDRLQEEQPQLAQVESLGMTEVTATGEFGFRIAGSVADERKAARLTIDVAACPRCLAEIRDPDNRRFRYPFTNCTDCGPRYSIITDMPYDRANTTMAGFTMCPVCSTEYEEPGDRRFHAQPNACPECGPQLALWDSGGKTLASHDEALSSATNFVREGGILAVKGIGGFHLIVDARDAKSVSRLRERKVRPDKPLAVMFPTIELVEQCCELSPRERAVLSGPRAPIVLLRKRQQTQGVAAEAIAPYNNWIGAFLPYTPLHHLLLDELGFAVVATSANRSGEPIVTDENEALERLAGIADAFLVHNRPIARPVDDTVVRLVAGEEMVLRRGRGYAPDPIGIDVQLPPIIAVGGFLKNTVACSVDKSICVSQHIGDLDTAEARIIFKKSLADFARLYDQPRDLVACDPHPDYPSTVHAHGTGLRRMPVQHHAAHIYACMAEHGLRPPVLGIAWDGMGLGGDGTLWGGEFLLFEKTGWRRVGHLRTFPLPGGEAAARDPRRAAFGLLRALCGEGFDFPRGAMTALYDAQTKQVLEQMVVKGVNSPTTSSAGRLFDAVAAFMGVCRTVSFEGQAAMALEYMAEKHETEEAYALDLKMSDDALLIADWAPMIRHLIGDLECGQPKEEMARRFHNGLAQSIAAVAARIGVEQVAFGGGCFQNKILTEVSYALLRAQGHKVYWPQRIPPNDGGLALGQLYGAARMMEAERCA